MSPHDRHGRHAAPGFRERGRSGLHRDWRFWAALVVMLAAIGMYVASLDDAVAPELEPAAEMAP